MTESASVTVANDLNGLIETSAWRLGNCGAFDQDIFPTSGCPNDVHQPAC